MAGRKTQNTKGNSRSPARSSERNPARSSARKSARNPEPKKSTGNAMALAILLWIAAAAMLLAILGGETGLRKIVCGIGGSWSIGLPVILIWLGILSASSAKGKRLDGWRICLNIAAIVLAYTARHMFEAERIIEGSQLKSGGYYINFIARSYRDRSGGGALGALLGWFFYQHLGGRWVGFFLCLLGIVACMTATGRTQKILDWGQARYAEYAREREPRKREPIRDEALEHAFDDDESDDEPDEAPVRRPRSAAEKPRSASPRAEMPRLRQKLYNVEMSSDTRPKRTSAQKPKPEPDPLFPEEDAEAAEIVPPTEEIPIPEEIPPTEEIEEPIAEDMPKPTESDIPQYLQKPKPVREEAASKPVPNPILNPIPNAAEEAAIMEKYRIEPEKYEPEEEPQAETKQEPDFLLLPDLKKWKKPVHEEKEEEVYPYPPIDLLNAGDEKKAKSNFKQDEEKANRLVQTLLSFGIETKLTGIAHGPVVTRYELQPAEGVKVSRITALTDDIALRLAAESVRLEAPIPGKEAVGVEVPNDERETVSLRDVLESEEARKHPSKIAIGLGKDNSGRFIVADIAKMPHVLIAGQTGSGKSVCINSLIVSILYRASPDEVKLILIDPKVVELSVYNGIPHLIAPVVTDPKKAASALDWAVSEMMDRYKRFAERGVRDIKGYNKKLSEGEKCMPQVVIVIDELSDLMMVAPGDVEDAICRLAQLARAAGMHIVIATQRPSVNVITGIIKANIPTRIAFSVASQIDSRTMIDHGGAEKLLGRGDMLYVPSGMKPMRVQGVWVSDDEVERVVEYIKSSSTPEYNEDMLEHMENATRTDAEKEEVQDEYDSKLPEAVEIVIEAGQASASMLQRRMKVGYARAGRMMDEMEQRGIIAPPDGANKSKPRNVLITREQFQRMFEDDA